MTVDAILEQSHVLDADLHRTLVRDIDNYALQAGVHKHMIWTPLSEIATEQEVKWVSALPNMRREGPYGLIYRGTKYDPPVETRMMGAAACCVRNFVDARVIPLHRLLEKIRQSEVSASVLLVPNFAVDEESGGYLPKWLKGPLLDLLYERFARQQITVLGINDFDKLGTDFGQPFVDLLERHYEPVEA